MKTVVGCLKRPWWAAQPIEIVRTALRDSISPVKDFVELYYKRNRGWPWPEVNWGLTPMFGDDGWCHACGVPQREQVGSLVLQRKGLSEPSGAWVPNWQFDVICMDDKVTERVTREFSVTTLPVAWPRVAPGEAYQVVIPSVGPAWFDPQELAERATARHGTAGAGCAECGVWRWMPLAFGMLPELRAKAHWDDYDVLASPEWFGDGWKAYRQILVRRELAELLAKSSPRDFKVAAVKEFVH